VVENSSVDTFDLVANLHILFFATKERTNQASRQSSWFWNIANE